MLLVSHWGIWEEKNGSFFAKCDHISSYERQKMSLIMLLKIYMERSNKY